MSELRNKLDSMVFAVRGAITPKLISEAKALVESEGATEESIAAFRDAFDGFRARGYLDTKSRSALDEAYAKLVAALPNVAENGGGIEALGAKLGQIKALVESRKVEVASLESKLSATESQIAAKSAQASSLILQKQQYQETLRQKERDRETLLIFAIFGAFGGASAAVGLGSALSISQLQSTIAQLDQEIAATQQQKASLESSLQYHRSEQRTKKRELEALKAVETTLGASFENGEISPDLEGPQKVAQLRARIHEGQALAENLRKQIELLKQMNASASAMSSELDGIISSLKEDLSILEKRIETSEKALLGVVIDLALAASGTPKSIQIGPFSIAKKTLLLEGLPGLRMAIDRQIDKLLEKMIADQLIESGTAPAIAEMIARALGRQAPEERKSAAVSALTDTAFASLSSPQRLVVDALLNNRDPGEAREALIASVLGAPSLKDVQARAAAAIALTDEGPAKGQLEAVNAVLSNASLTRAEAAKAVIDYGLSTTYGQAESSEENEQKLDRSNRLARRAISFFPPSAPAARALSDALSVLDSEPKTALEDHALLRAGLVAASALATQAKASTDQIALEVLRGHREATKHRSGENADDRRLLDAQRAFAAMKRLLPEGDALLVEAAPSDLASFTARLDQIEAGLTARVG
jgi:hypothetical protein